VTAGEDCLVIGPESFPTGLNLRVAGNTVYAQMHDRTGAFAVRLHGNALGNVLITITITIIKITSYYPINNSEIITGNNSAIHARDADRNKTRTAKLSKLFKDCNV
jgi:hypothetical protein